MSDDPANIRQFLMKFFSDQELKTLCFDYFAEVYDNFTAGMEKAQMVLILLGYCQRRGLLDNLLAALQKLRPAVYPQHFTPSLPGASQATAPTAQTLPSPSRSQASPDAAVSKPVASRDAPSSKVGQSIEIPHINIPGNTYVHEKTGLVMVRIPAGEFLYGFKKEKLYLPEFWISKTPVTQAHYQKFIEANLRYPVPYRSENWAKPYNWDKQSRAFPPDKKDHPVVLVSWHDATTFAQWAGLQLPTEQQWEKGARGTDGRTYPWGEQHPTPELCNFDRNVGGTTPAGKYSPQGDSPYGCVDMSGNVYEWTDSWYDELKTRRVLRGGSWDQVQKYEQMAFRDDYSPDGSFVALGFRLVSPVVSGS